MSDNQLQIIVDNSGLEKTKADYILEKFQDYFAIASEWEMRAKTIKVTEDNQTALMSMAREGRLFLREKRIAIEKSRKELKEQSLREGKAIDGIANVLKGLIEPIEKYLDAQENYTKYKIEAEVKERERLAREKIEQEEKLKAEQEKVEQEKIRIENEKLRRENEMKEKQLANERKKAELERMEKEKIQNELLKKQQKEVEEKKQIEIKAQQLKSAPDKEKIIDFISKLREMKLPELTEKYFQEVFSEFKKDMNNASKKLHEAIKDK